MVKTKLYRTTNMCLMLTICSGTLLIFQSMFPKAIAYRKDTTSKINEFMVEDRRIKKQNYLVQSDFESDIIGDTDNLDLVYPTAPLKYVKKSDEIPELIFDYANMIRNNIILLDNSVETRTRKRGNIKVEKYSVPLDPPCTCEYNKKTIELGNNYYPPYLEIANCSDQLCTHPYQCRKTVYRQAVLRSKLMLDETSLKEHLEASIPKDIEAPHDLRHEWVAVNLLVPTGCVCESDYIQQN